LNGGQRSNELRRRSIAVQRNSLAISCARSLTTPHWYASLSPANAAGMSDLHVPPPPPDDPFDAIVDAPFDSALSDRYLIYAMSTITARSLPDLRDGLKPVHRRLLWAMRLLKLDPASAYKKCARVVGDTIGKYHPHGDGAARAGFFAALSAGRWPGQFRQCRR
jgi:hypothetical protein